MTMGILVRIISEVYHIPSPSVVCNKGAHGHTGVIMGTVVYARIYKGPSMISAGFTLEKMIPLSATVPF